MIYPNIRIEMERGGFTVHQLAAILGCLLYTSRHDAFPLPGPLGQLIRPALPISKGRNL